MAKKKYIDQKALLDFAHNNVGGQIDCNDIARFPVSDVAEVVHGKWKVTVIEQTDSVFRTGSPHCSLCGKQSPLRYQYCPNCGAKMDGGAK